MKVLTAKTREMRDKFEARIRKVMPFGLTNAPATVQSLMHQVFGPFLRKFILVFFDDILIYSKSLEEHRDYLLTVLALLGQNQLFAKRSKCDFAQPQVEYMGHVISGQDVGTDPSKVITMVHWPAPKNLKELRGFLGLTGYYRKFVKNYSLISKPLTSLLRKGAFEWTLATQAFQELQTAMSSAPLLSLPNFNKTFIVEVDACSTGVGKRVIHWPTYVNP